MKLIIPNAYIAGHRLVERTDAITGVKSSAVWSKVEWRGNSADIPNPEKLAVGEYPELSVEVTIRANAKTFVSKKDNRGGAFIALEVVPERIHAPAPTANGKGNK